MGKRVSLFLTPRSGKTSTGVWSRETEAASHAPGASTDTRQSGAESDPRPVKKASQKKKESEREGREGGGERAIERVCERRGRPKNDVLHKATPLCCERVNTVRLRNGPAPHRRWLPRSVLSH